MKGSSAEEQGLDKDDIIIIFEGEDFYNRETLTNKVRQLGVGKDVTMEVIHLGQRKEVTLELKSLKNTTGWKYQNEPVIERYFQPTRILRFDPKDQDWIQMFDDQIPDNVKSNIEAIFNETYSSTSIINGKTYSVTIEGNPNNKDSEITVKIDKNEYKTTIGEIDKIPEDHQEAAKNAIENAKQKGTNGFPMFFDDTGNNLMPKLRLNTPSINNPNISDNQFFQQMEEQMRLMQQQFMELEKSHQKLLEQLNQNEQ